MSYWVGGKASGKDVFYLCIKMETGDTSTGKSN